MTSITRDGSIEFRFFRPGAGQVNLLGDFNQWDPTSMAMQSAGDGWWHARLRLAEGDYRFRYLADEQWYTDFAANGVEMGKAGFDSILVVPALNETHDLRQVA